jgi:1-acyl-sn-glycerol-3-phosphate acyltransferase
MISEYYPPVLQPFKNGPFRLAIENGVPVLPVTITNNWNLMWDDGKKYGSTPGICDIWVHAPIYTNEMEETDADKLKDKVYQIINNSLEKYQNQ